MKNPEFTIYYKESLFGAIGLIALVILITPVVILGIYSNVPAYGNSAFLNRTIFIVLLIISWLAVAYFVVFIKANYNTHKEITYKDGKFKFPESLVKHTYIEANVEHISQASVVTLKKGSVKLLQFSYKNKRHVINESSFEENEFSLICNAIVKRSDRCKACQSTHVKWSFDKGHCYNCETITPKNSDEFDWDNAYKA